MLPAIGNTIEGAVAAVIGWSTGAKGRACGLVTDATLVAPQLEWIAKVAREMGVGIGQ